MTTNSGFRLNGLIPIELVTFLLECISPSCKSFCLLLGILLAFPAALADAPKSSTANAFEQFPISQFIQVDQFGYLPESQKIAVIRDPVKGFDADLSFVPASKLHLVDVKTQAIVFSGTAQSWRQGAIAVASGDRAWWFDFSLIKKEGVYCVVDQQNQVRSPSFNISNNVYREVLKQAVRTFYYQRAGFAKVYPYADLGWTDGASHIGKGQDRAARRYDGGAESERDLSGGWFDAGDYNKYTNWHAWYLVSLLHTYIENPSIWTDDFNIPESGNGLPDLIDEINWGLDWLVRMQEPDGSVLSVQHLAGGSPPSSATGPTLYGGSSTSATLSAASAYAFASKILLQVDAVRFQDQAKQLVTRAERAWQWAELHPKVIFKNQEHNLAAGEQELSDAERQKRRVAAAIYLYAATQNEKYNQFVLANVDPIKFVNPWTVNDLTHYFYYASLPQASQKFIEAFRLAYQSKIRSADNLEATKAVRDPYMAYLDIKAFTWGSNRTVVYKGTLFYFLVANQFNQFDQDEMQNAALGYLHYLHGVNPLGKVYLSNMGAFGAYNSVDEFYHSWFNHGSPLWDRVGISTYGPAPGFLVGGPNPSYDWDEMCQRKPIDARCGIAVLRPPKGQPPMKSYLDFNDSWPVNSWQVTENHNDYQVAYIRLLSKFVH